MNDHIQRALLACCALTLTAACNKSDGPVEASKLGYRLPAGETHLTFIYPEVPGGEGLPPKRKKTVFRIPKEYVWFDGVLSKRMGNSIEIYQVPLEIELPSLAPRQKRPMPWRGSVAAEELVKNPPADWFLVRVGSGSGLGGRDRLLHSIKPDNGRGRKDIVADGQAYGLMRYSPIRCYTPKDLETPNLKAFLDAKPADDPIPEAHCRADRRHAELFSPPAVTNSDEVVFISCWEHRCDANFNFEGVGASMGFRQDKLPRWPDLVNPTRELLRSFIVREGAGTGRPSNSAISSSR